MAFTLTSRAFEKGKSIPVEHTCDGDDTSPPLRWEGEPKDTVTFALILEDPDAPNGTFTHWMIYNLPSDCHELEKTIPIQINLENGGIQLKSDFGKIGYGGPCPPPGEEHRYVFRIYALRAKIPQQSISNSSDFHNAIKDHIIDSAEYVGKYYRNT